MVAGHGQPDRTAFLDHGAYRFTDGQTGEAVDGLGVSPEALSLGDVIVQRHRFAQSSARAGLSFLTGAYWSDTLERWGVENVPNVDSLLVRLETPP